MKFLIIAILSACPGFGQAAAPVDVALHANVAQLVELSGARDKMVQELPQMMEKAVAQMKAASPSMDPRFFEEWRRRMLERLNIDEYMAATVSAYEAHLSGEDVAELVELMQSQKTNQPKAPSARLQAKLSEKLPVIMGQIVGATTTLGAKLGGDIGKEIETEHPEWAKAPRRPSPKALEHS